MSDLGVGLGPVFSVGFGPALQRAAYRSSIGWFTATALLGDSEPRRERHPSFRVADDCPDEFGPPVVNDALHEGSKS